MKEVIKKEVAIYKNLGHGSEILLEGRRRYDSDSLVRITEYADVEFKPLKGERVIGDQVKALKNMKSKFQAEAQVTANEFDRRINELLSIPHIKERPMPDEGSL